MHLTTMGEVQRTQRYSTQPPIDEVPDAIVKKAVEYIEDLSDTFRDGKVVKSHVCWMAFRDADEIESCPVLSRLPGLSNAFYGGGFGVWGVTVSPAAGRILAEMLLKQPLSVPLPAEKVMLKATFAEEQKVVFFCAAQCDVLCCAGKVSSTQSFETLSATCLVFYAFEHAGLSVSIWSWHARTITHSIAFARTFSAVAAAFFSHADSR